MMKKIRPKPIISCRWCGNQFFPNTANTKYCSEDCRQEAQKERDRQKKSMKICLRCNKPFETQKYSSRWYCDECKQSGKEQDGPKSRKGDRKKEQRKAEKMRRIKESGLTYGQYTAGVRNTVPAEYEGTISHSQLSNRWDEIKPAEENVILHPRAKLKMHPSILPPPPVIGRPERCSADQSEKGPDNAEKKEIEEEEKAEGTGHDLHEILQAQ